MTDVQNNFKFGEWRLSPTEPSVSFTFECSKFGRFQETVSFPSLTGPLSDQADTTLLHLLDMLHIALGVSYYKCNAAAQIQLANGMNSTQTVSFTKSLYTDGLAEFFVRANLPFPPELTVSVGDGSQLKSLPPISHATHDPCQAIVAFGGGKDSYVAAEIAKNAGVETTFCSVVLSDKVRNAIAGTSLMPVTFINRLLDPKLKTVATQGALNGHVPITAINSLCLMILAHLNGKRYVIFANERSADEPTIQTGDVTANHQFSKSSEFENILRDTIAAGATDAPEYFSVLRPFSEVWIAQRFAQLENTFPVFTSCNKNFNISQSAARRWCGDCAKCAFTTLMLMPFISRAQAKLIFGEPFAESSNLIPIFKELLGLSDQKPWDCVGTINECRAALFRASKQSEWQTSLLVRSLLPDILEEHSGDRLQQIWDDCLTPSSYHNLPAHFMSAADAL